MASRPLYTAQIARELGIYEQSAYYYIRKLLLIGAITESGTDFVRGGTARLYRTAFPAYGVEMDWGESLSFVYNQEDWKKKAENLIVRKFLKEFIDQDNKFDGLIIVGSPNPHGI
ncbi:MAG TPA: hypothetical protein VJR94_08840, partial [Candidatus Nitrosocosmicus sp.]|nr:hypothetical protein [Candidatus Nitrosocosmicus sp.]